MAATIRLRLRPARWLVVATAVAASLVARPSAAEEGLASPERTDVRETPHWRDFAWGLSVREATELAFREGFRIYRDPGQPTRPAPDESHLRFAVPEGYTDYALTDVNLWFESGRLRGLGLAARLESPDACAGERCKPAAEVIFGLLLERLRERYGSPSRCEKNVFMGHDQCAWSERGIWLRKRWGQRVSVVYWRFRYTDWRLGDEVEQAERARATPSRSDL